ncbi:Uncharacterised protein [Mycolicibacterium aurum]|uniref:Uncharacterized protein n=1 Tax=Mycolicibacterium aurum TaxID=1791 RepID=A0A3S4TZE8_MYCAU|nr:hypothetical protein [Mycolicibacterium aurum]VEG56566.1 Uncharacterised protein [Mycolicibacterium aurum]
MDEPQRKVVGNGLRGRPPNGIQGGMGTVDPDDDGPDPRMPMRHHGAMARSTFSAPEFAASAKTRYAVSS